MMDQTPQIIKLQDENAALRQALRDIAHAEAIPTASEAFYWCVNVATAALKD